MRRLIPFVFVAVCVSLTFAGYIDPKKCWKTVGKGHCNGNSHSQCIEFCKGQKGYNDGKCLVDGFCSCFAEKCTFAKVTGEPMYETLDGAVFWSHWECRHILVRTKTTKSSVPKFALYNTNKCQYGDCDRRMNSWWGSYPHDIELELYGFNLKVIVNNRAERWFEVDGVRKALPWDYEQGDKFIRVQRLASYWRSGGSYGAVEITTNFGLKLIVTAGVRNLQVHIPEAPEFMNNLEGALGNLDGDDTNDFQRPNGQMFYQGNRMQDNNLGEQFLWHWRADDRADCRKKPKGFSQKCNKKLMSTAVDYCNTTLYDAFSNCYKAPYMTQWLAQFAQRVKTYGTWYSNYITRYYGSVEKYIKRIQDNYARWLPGYMKQRANNIQSQCILDICGAGKPKDAIENGACDSLVSFERHCKMFKFGIDKGLQNWHTNKFCPLNCDDPNSHYESCAGCQQTCQNRDLRRKALQEECLLTCELDGCVCNNGYVLDEKSGKCLKKAQCPAGCVYKGDNLDAGDFVYNDNCSQKCECGRNGKTKCKRNGCSRGKQCVIKDGRRGCFKI